MSRTPLSLGRMPAPAILDSQPVATLWPLAAGSDIRSLILAGRTLSGWQLGEWQGIDGTGCTQIANCWVNADDAAALAVVPGPARLLTPCGIALAWRGNADADTTITASPSSFALVHPWDVLRLHEYLVGRLDSSAIDGEFSIAAHLNGILLLGTGSRILPGVVIEGNVAIGRDCAIGPNCYLRGNTSIGDHCHIGNAVEIKNTLIGSHSNVAHLSYVGDSILGDHVNLGAGTITANFRHDGGIHHSMVAGNPICTGRKKFGAVIGDGVHTGIHTAIYPGRKLGPASSTLPGAVVTQDLRGVNAP